MFSSIRRIEVVEWRHICGHSFLTARAVSNNRAEGEMGSAGRMSVASAVHTN
jgi:hypothetical protein